MRRRQTVLWLTAALALALAAVATFVRRDAAADDSFYRAQPVQIIGAPGTLIRTERLELGLMLEADAYRILYRSTGLNGEPIAVSGMVIAPRGVPPEGGRPLVAWAHPTSGVVSRCAPSLAIFKFQQIQGLREMVARGFVVAATDYPGLGTPGPHPYLVGVSEGRAVLDSLRAARRLVGSAASRTAALWGHSQGGQAVLYAGLIARTYAPELDIVGAAAAAPATDLRTLMADDLGSTGGKNLLAMTLWAWQRVFDAPMAKVILPGAEGTVDQLADDCLETPLDLRRRGELGRLLDVAFLSVPDPTEIEPWQSLLAQNTIGPPPSDLPLFIAQGEADDIVDPPVTKDYVAAVCAAGGRVRLLTLPGVGHGWIGRDSAAAAVAWMADRFAGRPVPSDCL